MANERYHHPLLSLQYFTTRGAHLRIDDPCLRKRHPEGRASIANCVVFTFLVHHETDVPPRRWNAEQVGRRYECGAVIVLSIMKMSPLLQLVGVLDDPVLKKTGAARRGGGKGEGTRTPKPHQQYQAGRESGRWHLCGCTVAGRPTEQASPTGAQHGRSCISPQFPILSRPVPALSR